MKLPCCVPKVICGVLSHVIHFHQPHRFNTLRRRYHFLVHLPIVVRNSVLDRIECPGIVLSINLQKSTKVHVQTTCKESDFPQISLWCFSLITCWVLYTTVLQSGRMLMEWRVTVNSAPLKFMVPSIFEFVFVRKATQILFSGIS